MQDRSPRLPERQEASSTVAERVMGVSAELYLQAQTFNPVVAFLHKQRFRALMREVRALSLSRPIRVLDLGAGPAKAFEVLDRIIRIDYTGIDTNPNFFQFAMSRYGHAANFRMLNASFLDDSLIASLGNFDLAIALETMEHIGPSAAETLARTMVKLGVGKFICSVPIEVGPPAALKNIGSALCGYGRHQEYSAADTLWATLGRVDKVRPHDGGHRGFDWRQLSTMLSIYYPRKKVTLLPFSALPAWFNTSAFFVCER
jgi:SAM-dependent methyltransferase